MQGNLFDTIGNNQEHQWVASVDRAFRMRFKDDTPCKFVKHDPMDMFRVLVETMDGRFVWAKMRDNRPIWLNPRTDNFEVNIPSDNWEVEFYPYMEIR